jgi:hypothetical protein
MVMRQRILVTGAPRSGTTFLGRMLSLLPEVQEISEPYNFETGLEGVDQPFPYIGPSDIGSALEKKYTLLTEELLDGSAQFRHSTLIPDTSNPLRQAARTLLISRQNVQYKLQSKDPRKNTLLVKDPNACFLSEYLDKQFDFMTVVIMRHPASTVASYKRLGWQYSLDDLKDQRSLMDDYLRPCLGNVEPAKLSDIERWAYLWLAVYTVLEGVQKHDSRMSLITHEALSTKPHKTLRGLYKKFGFEYSEYVKETVDIFTSRDNPIGPRENAIHDLYRNSAAMIRSWQQALTPKEIATIRTITEPVASKHYTNSDWGAA